MRCKISENEIRPDKVKLTENLFGRPFENTKVSKKTQFSPVPKNSTFTQFRGLNTVLTLYKSQEIELSASGSKEVK